MAYAPDGGTLEYVITPGKTEVNKKFPSLVRREFLVFMPAASVRRPAACCRGPDCGLRGDGGGRGSRGCLRHGPKRGRCPAKRVVPRQVPQPQPQSQPPGVRCGGPGRYDPNGRPVRRVRGPNRNALPRCDPRAPGRSGRGSRRERISGLRPRSRGNSALRMSRSMNFSIWWNLPCSSSLTNVMAAPEAAARPYGRCGGCNPRGRAARRS